MRTSRLAAAAGLTALGLLLAACGSGTHTASGSSGSDQPVTGGTLNMLGAGDVDYMDPNLSYYSIGYLNLRMWSRQLFTYPATPGGANTAPVTDLATEIPTQANGGISADGKTYTVHLRGGVKWNTSPAREVTAADLVRGVKRTANPVQPFGGIPDFATLIAGYQAFQNGFAKVAATSAAIAKYLDDTPLPGVVAKDASTVVFHLTRPATYFVDMLTLPAFSPAPVEVLKYLPASTALGNHEPSDGPYQVDSWVPTKSINYSRNPVWDPATDSVRKAYVDRIVVNETLSQDSIQQQLSTSSPTADLGFDVGPPPSQLPGLISKKDPDLTLGPTASTNPYVLYNTVSPNNSGALADVRVRQAISYALDRSNLLQVLGGPTINPPLTHVLPSSILGSKQFDPYPHDLAKAKQLLAAAGHAHLRLKLLYRSASQGSTKAFQTIQQDLSAAGITVVGVPSPNADFYVKYLQVPTVARRGVWDLSLASWGPDWYGNAALSFFNPLFSGQPSYPPVGSNFGLYNDPTTNSLVQQAIAASTLDQAEALWAKADQRVMAMAPFYPLTSPLNASYHASQVHNAVYVPSLQMFDPTNVWLSKNEQG